MRTHAILLDSVTPAVVPADGEVALPVFGLLPDTTYELRLIACGDGGTVSSEPLHITTGSLPGDLPRFQAGGPARSPGYVLVLVPVGGALDRSLWGNQVDPSQTDMSDPQGARTSESRADGGGQPLEVRLLGGFSLSTPSGGPIMLPGTRRRALLAYLLLHRDRPVDRRHLAFLLWPESTEPQALTNLRQLIHDVRAAIPDADRFIEAGRQLVGWVHDAPLVLDVDRFEAAVGPEAGSAALAAGIELYAGDLLPECYDEWIEPLRRRLRDLLVDALRRMVALFEERRAFSAAIEHAERLRGLEPLDENATLALMRLHAAQGRRALALDTYARTETLLREELGTQPMPALRDLRDRLLRAPEGEEPSPATGTVGPAFIDRAAEWTRLTRAWSAASRARPCCLLVSGIPGIGKTRLCTEFAAWARRQGATVAMSSCYRTVGSLPYAPVVDWLRSPMLTGAVAGMASEWRAELGGLLPDLAGTRAATFDGSSAGPRGCSTRWCGPSARRHRPGCSCSTTFNGPTHRPPAESRHAFSQAAEESLQPRRNAGRTLVE